MDLGHWKYPYEFDPNDWFGFIYRIVEIDTGRHYIGKKQFSSYTRKTIKDRKNKKRIKKESDWREYMSSSEHLKSAIETNGMGNYEFLIESLHKTRGSLYYAEVSKQVTEDVLRARLDDGVTPKYYNRQIGSVRFIPPVELFEEIQMRVKHNLV